MRQYQMDRCELTWATINLKEGVARQTWLQEARAEATWTMIQTGMGDVVRNFMPGTSGTLTLPIVQTSKVHKRLYDIASLDRQTRIQVYPMILTDPSSEIFTYVNTFILTEPDEARAMEAGIFTIRVELVIIQVPFTTLSCRFCSSMYTNCSV